MCRAASSGWLTGYIPGYGGYGAYLAVDPRQRGRGIGTRLWQLLVHRLHFDATCAGVPLPFVVWESRPPSVPSGERACACGRGPVTPFTAALFRPTAAHAWSR